MTPEGGRGRFHPKEFDSALTSEKLLSRFRQAFLKTR
jgi:hypothetical protein